VAQGAAVSAEALLEAALLALFAADDGVKVVLGDPVRVIERDGPLPAYPYLEVARHLVQPAGSSGVEANEHRIDFVVTSRLDGGAAGRDGVAAMRKALDGAGLTTDGWRCVLLLPAFADTLNGGNGYWRSILRIRAIMEAV
jgi:hypothetical protein